MAKFDKIKAGQSVAFTINNGGVENEGFGTLHNINKDKTRILVKKIVFFCFFFVCSISLSFLLIICFISFQLKDVIFTKSKKKFSGIMQFYADEIQSIEIICDVHDENETFSNTLEQNPTESDGIDQMLRKLDFVGDEDDVIHILKQWNVYIIEKVGEQCDIALKDIFENEFVALSSAMNDAKHVILILCTRRKTYAFNIGSIGAVPDRLKELLESDAHTKVVYDKSLLPGGIKLTRIFDTSVVHKLNNIALPSKLLQKLNKVVVRVAIVIQAILLTD